VSPVKYELGFYIPEGDILHYNPFPSRGKAKSTGYVGLDLASVPAAEV
jgi:hypothetical protein